MIFKGAGFDCSEFLLQTAYKPRSECRDTFRDDRQPICLPRRRHQPRLADLAGLGPPARRAFANYEDRLANGEVDIPELVVSKRITREPRDYQKAGVTAIAAQQLFGSGVKLRPGQNIEYVITNAKAHVPNDRVRAYALWEGWFGYNRKKYAAMLHEAFEPFLICAPKREEHILLSDSISEEDLRGLPLFSTLPVSRS